MGDVRTERGDLVPGRWARYWPYADELLRDCISELASWQARAEAAEKLATHLDQLQSDYAQKYCAETASRLQWQARAEQLERERKEEALEYARALKCSESLGKRLSEEKARAEQAESTIAAWKKDAEDKAVLIASLEQEVRRLREALISPDGSQVRLEEEIETAWADERALSARNQGQAVKPAWGFSGYLEVLPKDEPGAVNDSKEGVMSRSTDLERDNG